MVLGGHQGVGCLAGNRPDWVSRFRNREPMAVQSGPDDAESTGIIAPLDHAPIGVGVTAERALLAALEGGCQVPIGALATDVAGSLILHGLIAELSGRRVLRGSAAVDPSCPAVAGEKLASVLLADGAGDILAALREKKTIPMPQPE